MASADNKQPKTKKIKLRTGLAGVGFSHKAGEVIERPAAEADAHVRLGDADYHEDLPEKGEK